MNKAYVMNIHPAREKQEDYPEVTSNLILKEMNNGFLLANDDIKPFENLKNTVILVMSPNDLSKLENEIIDLYQ